MPAKNVVALYGGTGEGKTSLLETFLAGWREDKANEGKRIRLYTAESAQIKPLSPSIESGRVDMWAIDNATFPFERIRDCTQGAWPIDPMDPVSPVVSAWVIKHIARCPEDQTLVYQSEKAPAQVMQTCPKCRRPVATRVVREVNPANGLDKTGVVIFESGTEFGDMMMRNMSDRSAKGEKIGEETAARFVDGTMNIAGQSRTSYGLAQRHMKNAIGESKHLPVDWVFWTFAKERGQDEDRRVPIFGPKLPGSAVTGDVPRWFGPTLQAIIVPTQGKGVEYRLYVKPFYETWNPITKDVQNIVNNRIPPAYLDGLPDYYTFTPSDHTLLWRVMREIEQRQAGTFKGTQTATAK